MAAQGSAGHIELLGSPRKSQCCAIQLGLADLLFVKVAFAEDQKMTGRVIVCRSVTGDLGCAQLVDVSVAVDTDVVGDIDPAALVLMKGLMLTKASRGIGVVAQIHRGVVNRHAGDGVRSAAG